MNLLFALVSPTFGLSQMEPSQGSPLTGVYSNVRYSDETGDAGGFEVALDADDGASPSVIFTICEGGCYGGERWPVQIDGARLAFRVTHQWTSGEDGPVRMEAEDYEGVVEGDVLILRSPQIPGPDPQLRRVPHPTPGQTARLGGKAD